MESSSFALCFQNAQPCAPDTKKLPDLDWRCALNSHVLINLLDQRAVLAVAIFQPPAIITQMQARMFSRNKRVVAQTNIAVLAPPNCQRPLVRLEASIAGLRVQPQDAPILDAAHNHNLDNQNGCHSFLWLSISKV